MPLQSVNLHDKKEGEKFQPTADEMRTIAEKFKDPEFQKLWADYMKDLQDPKYREEEEAYLRQVEQEARDGGDASFDFVFPKPGFVIELLQADGKTFVNMCSSDKIDEFKEEATGDRSASKWHVPVSVGKQRDDSFDNRDVFLFDAVFHPKTLGLADRSDRFMCFLAEIAIENINHGYQKNFGFEFRRLGSPAAIGTPANQTIQRQAGKGSPFAASADPMSTHPGAPVPSANAAPAASSAPAKDLKYVPPKPPAENLPEFTVLHRGEVDLSDAWNWKRSDKRVGVPAELVLKVHFKGVKSAAVLDIEIRGPYIEITKSEKHPYYGAINLPFSVEDTPASAKFERTKEVLTLVLKVIPPAREEPELEVKQQEVEAEPEEPAVQEEHAEKSAVSHVDPTPAKETPTATEEESADATKEEDTVSSSPAETAPKHVVGDEDRYQKMMAAINKAREEREAQEREAEERKAAEAAQKSVVEEEQADEETNGKQDADGDAPEVIDLRSKQQEWLQNVQGETKAEPEAPKVSAMVDPLLREEEEERKAEMERKMKEAKRREAAEREAERLELELRKKIETLPLACKHIFDIE